MSDAWPVPGVPTRPVGTVGACVSPPTGVVGVALTGAVAAEAFAELSTATTVYA